MPFTRTEVVELPDKSLAVVTVPSMGYALIDSVNLDKSQGVKVAETVEGFVLENAFVKATINAQGRLVSLFDKKNGRECIEQGKYANQFMMFEDIPMYWDAWDVDVYHLEKRSDIQGGSVKIIETNALRVSLEVNLPISKTSTMTQRISLSAVSPRLDFQCEIDWDESHKFLKVEFPLNVRSLSATYEIQFGHVPRPTHWNTSWEVAKFEVCAQKWADLSESGYGVALLNDCKYGHATHGNVMRLSLLRSSKNPDPEADIGHHTIRYALLPHAGTFQEANVIQESYAFNAPLLVKNAVLKTGMPATASLFSVNKNSVIVETVKKSENNNKELIVRLYECHGGRGSFRLESSLQIKSVALCGMIEQAAQEKALDWMNGGVTLQVSPFQIVTLRIKF